MKTIIMILLLILGMNSCASDQLMIEERTLLSNQYKVRIPKGYEFSHFCDGESVVNNYRYNADEFIIFQEQASIFPFDTMSMSFQGSIENGLLNLCYRKDTIYGTLLLNNNCKCHFKLLDKTKQYYMNFLESIEVMPISNH